MKFEKNIDFFSKKQVLDGLSVLNDEENKYITETAGFIPLEVKLRQFEQNGLIAQFKVSDFDSNDYRELYLNPDYAINPEDDLEDIQEKLKARNDYMKNIQEKKSKVGSFEETANSLSDSAAADKKKLDENKDDNKDE